MVFGVGIPSRRIERMNVVEFADRRGFRTTALGTSVGLNAFRRFGRLGRNFALVPYMLFYRGFFTLVSASRRVPVADFVVFPNSCVKSVRMRKFGNGFVLLISASVAGKSFYAFAILRGLNDYFSRVEVVSDFFRSIGVFFGKTFVPVTRFVILPLV